MACVDEKQTAQQFAEFYCNLMDKHRAYIASYLAEDAVLDWFGRTISGQESIANFVNLQVPETVHEFLSFEPTGPIQHRKKCFGAALNDAVMMTETYAMQGLEDLATPFGHQEVGQGDADGAVGVCFQNLKINEGIEDSANCSNERGDSWEYKFTTPVNKEMGPLMNSTSLGGGGGDGDGFMTLAGNSVATCANRYLEARGCIQFQRTKQSRVAPKNMKLVCDTMKWERSCKLKIAYGTEGVVNHEQLGDGISRGFKIWLLVYQDNTKCRRNLIGAFEQE